MQIEKILTVHFVFSRIVQLVQRLDKASRTDVRTTAGAKFSEPIQTGPEAHPVKSLSQWKKRPERGVDHPHPSSPRIRYWWTYTCVSPTACSARKGTSLIYNTVSRISNTAVTDSKFQTVIRNPSTWHHLEQIPFTASSQRIYITFV
jgi:hypothetical protein